MHSNSKEPTQKKWCTIRSIRLVCTAIVGIMDVLRTLQSLSCRLPINMLHPAGSTPLARVPCAAVLFAAMFLSSNMLQLQLPGTEAWTSLAQLQAVEPAACDLL